MTPEANRIRLLMIAVAVRVLLRDPSAKEAAIRAADQIGTQEAKQDFDLQYELSVYIKDNKLLDHAESYIADHLPDNTTQQIKRLLLELETSTIIDPKHLEQGQHRMRQAAEAVFHEKGTHGTRRLAVNKAKEAAESYVKQYATNNRVLLAKLLELLPQIVNQVRNHVYTN
jgi:hypothetical protein